MSIENRPSFVAIITVFFFWGFLAASNGIFIPFCKTHFHLTQFQSQLVDSAFYGAYFVGSLLLYMFSLQLNKDVINSVGYKKTIIYGLIISIAGAIVMIPAVNSGSFVFILVAFFIVALGFSLQQMSANPLVLYLGDPSKGSHRLNFAGSINSFGTTIGPILVSIILFGKIIATKNDIDTASISSINVLYVILIIAFIIATVVLNFTKVPKLSIEDDSPEMKILRSPLLFIISVLVFLALVFIGFAVNSFSTDKTEFLFVLILGLLLVTLAVVLRLQFGKIKKENRLETASYPQVILGMIAIFVYVGVEVTIQSNLGALLKQPDFGGLEDSEISPYISLYWGSLMIGRWTGSIGAFKLGKLARIILTAIVPFLALSLVMYMNHLNGVDFLKFTSYCVCVAILVIAFYMTQQKPALTLKVFSILATGAMILGLFTTGIVSTYSFLSGGLFCSIMWPCIFSLSTAGLGRFTSQASGFLIMMILGGAFIPPLQGIIADKINIHFSYWVTVLCFVFLTWYAFKAQQILKRSGIDFDSGSNTTGH